jgi:hypothetical protein
MTIMEILPFEIYKKSTPTNVGMNENNIINFSHKNINDQHIQYLFVDVERRLNKLNELEVCSVGLSALDGHQKQVFPPIEFLLKGAHNCPRFIEDQLSNYSSPQALILDTREPRDFVSSLFSTLQHNRWRSNTQLVAFNLKHDEGILRDMFHEFGFPFYWDDKGFENGDRKEGPFGYNGIDILQIGFQCRARNLKNSEITRSRLMDTAASFGVKVHKELLHTARYDCFLAQQIFHRNQEALDQLNRLKVA